MEKTDSWNKCHIRFLHWLLWHAIGGYKWQWCGVKGHFLYMVPRNPTVKGPLQTSTWPLEEAPCHRPEKNQETQASKSREQCCLWKRMAQSASGFSWLTRRSSISDIPLSFSHLFFYCCFSFVQKATFYALWYSDPSPGRWYMYFIKTLIKMKPNPWRSLEVSYMCCTQASGIPG